MNIRVLVFLMVPVAAFCGNGRLYIADFKDEPLLAIAHFEDEVEEPLENAYNLVEMEAEIDESGLSLLEIDEQDGSLLPWSSEPLNTEEFPAFIDKKVGEMTRSYDDAFTYDLPANTKSGKYEPSFEAIPGEQGSIIPPPQAQWQKPALKQAPKETVKVQVAEDSKQLQEFVGEDQEEQEIAPSRRQRAKRSRSSLGFSKRKH